MKTQLLTLSILITFFSCHKNESQTYALSSIDVDEIPITRQNNINPNQNIDIADTATVNKKKIIKDGRIKIDVSDIEYAKTYVDSIVNINGGYYAKENFDKSKFYLSYDLVIKVPARNFENLISSIGNQEGEISFKNIDARDVTDKFIDLETRLTNKKSYIKRYVLLLNKATEIKEILEIQEKLRNLEEEVESTEGQLKYLSDQVNFSKLELTLNEDLEYNYHPNYDIKFWEEFKDSLSGGWYGLINFILFLIRIWPLIIITLIATYFIRKLIKRKRLNKKNK